MTRMATREWAFFATALAASSVSSFARADDHAQAAFDEGLAAMKAERFDVGCPKLAESYRLDPLPGALFTLAECEVRWNRVLSALRHYETYLDRFEKMGADERARQRGRDKVAMSQAAALRPRVPRIIVRIDGGVPPGGSVSVDGKLLAASAVGVPVPVDPGDHVVVLRRPGAADESSRVTVEVGTERVVALRGGAVADATPLEETPRDATSASRPPRTGWILLGVGAVALVGGGVSSLVALQNKSDVDAHCLDRVCDAQGLAAVDRARTWGWVGTGLLGVGVASAAIGGVVLLTSGSKRETRLGLAPGPQSLGLTMRGRF